MITVLIELDDGNILTGKPPNNLMVKTCKNHGFPVKIFPRKPILTGKPYI